jgi:UDP:flavonoid glycosyltransferase YjiC (YdhE family)
LRLLYGLKRIARKNERALGSQRALFGEVQRIRLSAGLPERAPDAAALAPERVLCMWPSWFSSPQHDWPEGARTTGFPFHPLPDRSGLKGNGHFAVESPPIVFTRGSAASHQRPFFEAASECCRLLGRKGILATPHADDVPRELPTGVTHLSFAPFEKIFFEASAVVHHGGIGTIAYALASGTPQIAVPIIGEQFDLGYRLERLGVGRMVTETPLTAGRRARELESLLRSKRIQDRCRQLGPRVGPESGCVGAADVVEEIAGSRGSKPHGFGT